MDVAEEERGVMGDGAEAEESVGGGREAGGERSAPAMVTFPDARRNLNSIPPIKLEAEDAADDATPHTMWQVNEPNYTTFLASSSLLCRRR